MADKNTVYMSEKQKVKEITDKLEAGLKELFESEKYKSYLSTMSKFHNYSFNNTLLIAMQKPEATLVAGYQAWQKNFERHVNKGEKAIRILAPAPYKIKEERDKLDPVTGEMMFDENGMPQKEETEVTIPAFRAVSVFDVSQTDGKPIPELEVNELLSTVEGYEDFVQALMNISPVPIAFEDIPGDSKGYFSTAEKRIAVQENMSESQTLKTMVHEVAHSMLHDKEVNQSMDIPVKDRNTKEVEAESVAFTVCQHFGIDTSDYSFGYIAGWSSGRNMKELKSSLDTIRKTASELITGIEGAMQELQLNREMEQEHGKESILLVHNEDFSEYNLVSVRGMDSAELISALSTMNEEDKSNISSYLESKGAWTTELADEQTEEAEEYHIDVRYNMDTDELIDVKERMEQPIDTNLSVMGQAEQLINQLEAEKNIFTSEERNLIVNYAYKLDDMNKTRELAEKLAYREQYAQQDVALTIIDAKAEIDALPDPMIGLSEMREYGYQWNEMLPLTQEKALELFEHDLPVYLLHTDGAESLAESRERIEEHEGIFGVEKETWNKALKQQTKITLILMDEQEREYTYPYPVVAVDIEEMGGDRTAVFKTSEPISDTDVAEIHNAFYGTDLEFEIEKELGITWVESINYEDGSVITPEMARKEQLLYASTDKYGIYQLKPNPELDSLRFEGTESLKRMGITKDNFDAIKPENYTLLYVGELSELQKETQGATLEAIFEKFNLDHPEDFRGHSLSVSDIVVLHQNGQNTAHFVDSFGYTELPDFLREQIPEREVLQDTSGHNVQKTEPEIDGDEIIDLGDETEQVFRTGRCYTALLHDGIRSSRGICRDLCHTPLSAQRRYLFHRHCRSHGRHSDTIGACGGKSGEARLVYTGNAAIITGILLLVFAHNIPCYLLLAALLGYSFGAVQPALQTMVMPAERRGAASSTFFVAFDFGIALGGFFAGLLVKYREYDDMFLGMLLVLLLSIVLHYLFGRRHPSSSPPQKKEYGMNRITRKSDIFGRICFKPTYLF